MAIETTVDELWCTDLCHFRLDSYYRNEEIILVCRNCGTRASENYETRCFKSYAVCENCYKGVCNFTHGGEPEQPSAKIGAIVWE